MKDLSLHILDIAENAIRAKADLVEITIDENMSNDTVTIEIRDNGRGMHPEEVDRACDPFYTTKNNKRFGLGLALLSDAARMAGGNLEIKSRKDFGTEIKAVFQYSHIDRKPLGDVGGTLETLIIGNLGVDFIFRHKNATTEDFFDTRTVRGSREIPEMLKKIRQTKNP